MVIQKDCQIVLSMLYLPVLVMDKKSVLRAVSLSHQNVYLEKTNVLGENIWKKGLCFLQIINAFAGLCLHLHFL